MKSLDPPVAPGGTRLAFSFSSSAAGTKTWGVEGAFGSPTAASGTLTTAGSSGAFVGGPTGSLDATWTAAKTRG